MYPGNGERTLKAILTSTYSHRGAHRSRLLTLSRGTVATEDSKLRIYLLAKSVLINAQAHTKDRAAAA